MTKVKAALYAATLVDTHISCPFLRNECRQDDRRCTAYQKIAKKVRGCATCRIKTRVPLPCVNDTTHKPAQCVVLPVASASAT